MQGPLFLEIDVAQKAKEGQSIFGDTFMSQPAQEKNRIISVLSDGLGSGVKANILSSMTASMALRFIASDMDFLHSAEIMMEALPVCQVRNISYATFTIVDSVLKGWTRIIEMDNPKTIFIRDNQILPLTYREVESPRWNKRKILLSEILTKPEDRIILLSDGITQSGMGSWSYPLGWGEEGCQTLVLEVVKKKPYISAQELSELILEEALSKEPLRKAGDDMTCSVMYFRRPRNLILLTGPPFAKDKDGEYAAMLETFEGSKVVCGGTTADIVARELGRDIETDISTGAPGIPPLSIIKGVDLVTEGILTLTEANKILKNNEGLDRNNPAAKLARLLMGNDVIQFVVGTRINEAHQDPSLPVEIEIRRNIVKNLSNTLREKYLKKTSIRYI
ncbi:SpoIIE family protein phosphatase [Dethiosulfovibrio salsuginis]|uniref:Stage II sporulation protein E (SpoIIE) n=1 Tax=Dethiosulfovibrio salsuginis TaxID=561720 RepID=A0A1X7IMQ5_9BACT|nr:SpoIIE family protein phosphatase [Dethiosulfovibrio salsuginis]SMG15899.1 Stage II sporulation protein E (SpoIIE) [Dethiosulfovibrio salsuginis]